jgi:hypothetical protein
MQHLNASDCMPLDDVCTAALSFIFYGEHDSDYWWEVWSHMAHMT